MADVLINFGTFSTTTIEVSAQTEAAKAVFARSFGYGAVGATLRKSATDDFATHCRAAGLTVKVAHAD